MNRELRHDFAKHHRDQELADTDDDKPPNRGRSANGHDDCEERIDADERREIGETEREVIPQPHRTAEGIVVAKHIQVLDVTHVFLGHDDLSWWKEVAADSGC